LLVLSFAAMSRKQPPQQPAASAQEATAPERDAEVKTPLSLSRLREAFAAMLNPQGAGSKEQGDSLAPCPMPRAPCPDPCEINPRTIVEAMLFVGRPDRQAFSAREMAATMRGVSPAEIDAAVAELNALYDDDGAAYQIAGSPAGYQLVLREKFDRMRDKFHGRVRETKLSPATLEVLSIVAYQQPITAETINAQRGAPSGGVLQTLVRRELVRLERPANQGQCPVFSTTDRFLRLFGLENIAALPRSEDLGKA
jgi:segregation and condensation protein B